MRLYIYTIPKAGTYLLADFIARLGFQNTGLHVEERRVLNTSRFDLETNAQYPSRTEESRHFIQTLQDQPNNSLSFGHFPVPIMGWMFPDYRFICAYRHPRRTLVSEFIDFRFRRLDVDWVSRQSISDDSDAFVEFLMRNGAGHMAIFSEMLGLGLLVNESLCTSYSPNRIHFLSFDDFVSKSDEAEAIARFLRVDPIRAKAAHIDALAADTKTKATGLEINRSALWSERAEEIYESLKAESYVLRGRQLGWKI